MFWFNTLRLSVFLLKIRCQLLSRTQFCVFWEVGRDSLKHEMTWRRNGLHECMQISMRLVVVTVLLGTGRIDPGVVMLTEGGASSGQWILVRKSVLGANDSSEGGVTLGTTGGCSAWHTLLSVSSGFWRDVTHVLILIQVRNWPLQMPPPLSLSPSSKEKVERTDLARAWEVKASFVLWRDWSKYLFAFWALFENWSAWKQLAN